MTTYLLKRVETMKCQKIKVPQGFLDFAGLCEILGWCRGTELNRPHADFQSVKRRNKFMVICAYCTSAEVQFTLPLTNC
jgi:hypothetical protein